MAAELGERGRREPKALDQGWLMGRRPCTRVGLSHTQGMYTRKPLPCLCQACLGPQGLEKWEQKAAKQMGDLGERSVWTAVLSC